MTCAGLRDLHTLTSGGDFELRVDLQDWDGNMTYAVYSNFQVGDADSHYRLEYGSFDGGDAGQLLMMMMMQIMRRKKTMVMCSPIAVDLHVLCLSC